MALTVLSRALVLPVLTLLMACGTGQQDPLLTAARTIGTGLFGGGGDAPQGQPLSAATLPPALLAQVEGPLILVETTRLGGSTLMTQVGSNGPDTTWRSPEGWGITLGDGALLRSSRGLGFDLMASDVAATRDALASGRAGPVERTLVHLDGEAQERRAVHACTLTLDGPDRRTILGQDRALRRMTETCRTGTGASYENIYWLDTAGRAIQSFQWVGPEIGHMQITLLRDG